MGQVKEIDIVICVKIDGCNEVCWFLLMMCNVNDGQIQGVINKLWGVDMNYKFVSKFYVFYDFINFYGSMGNVCGQVVVNIFNVVFLILMVCNDKNYWLVFGEKCVWDKNELVYIMEVFFFVELENVMCDIVIFNLLFILLG